MRAAFALPTVSPRCCECSRLSALLLKTVVLCPLVLGALCPRCRRRVKRVSVRQSLPYLSDIDGGGVPVSQRTGLLAIVNLSSPPAINWSCVNQER